MNTVAPQKPDARNYLDVRDYLTAVYNFKKETVPGFSYSAWADGMKITSRTFLRLLVTGKRGITENMMPTLVKGLELHGAEADYFVSLVHFTQSKNFSTRDYYAGELSKHRSRGAGPANPKKIVDHFRFSSSRLAPRLQVLLGHPGVDRSTESLTKLLRVKKSEIEDTLGILQSLGLAAPEGGASADKNCQWVAVDTSFEVEESLGDLALQSFHKKSLEEAALAIDLPVEQRRFQSLLVLLTEDELKELHSETHSFMLAMLKKFPGRELKGQRLYQANFSLIPVSEPVLHPEKSHDALAGSNSQKTIQTEWRKSVL